MLKKITKETVDRMTVGDVLWDTEIAGFGVRRQVAKRSYVLKYRFKGRQRLLTLGKHGEDITADEARRRAIRSRGLVADGRDPADELAARRAPSKGDFAQTVDKFVRLYAKPNNRTWEETEWIFKKYVTPGWRTRSVSEIKRRDVAELLDTIETNNGPVMADRVLAAVRKLFNWVATRDDDFRSPIVKGMSRTKPSERKRQRCLTDEEIKAVWVACHATKPPIYGLLVRFLLLTGQRRDEVAAAKWTEVCGDTWTIPAERYKTKIPNVVPLSEAAMAVVAGLPQIGPYVFSTLGDRPFSGFSKCKQRLDAKSGVKSWVLHDLRRTAKTLMQRAGVRPDISERVLGHVIPGVEGTYDRHDYIAEKRSALEQLAATIDTIVNS